MLPDLHRSHFHIGMELHVGPYPLVGLLGWHTNHTGLRNLGMGVDDVLHLVGMDCHGRTADRVLGAADEADVALVVNLAGHVAGAEEAIGRKDLGIQLRSVPVALEHRAAADVDLASLSRRDLSALEVHKPDLIVGQYFTVGPEDHLGRGIDGRERGAGCFCHPVSGPREAAELLLDCFD